MPSLPFVTRILLVANVLIFLLQQMPGDSMLVYFALWPLGPPQPAQLDNGSVAMVGFEPWQLLTYGFLHGGYAHIAFNMLALWMFGGPVEDALGARPLHAVLPCLRARRGMRTIGGCTLFLADGFLSDPGRFRRRVRFAAGVRDAVSARARSSCCFSRCRLPRRSPWSAT